MILNVKCVVLFELTSFLNNFTLPTPDGDTVTNISEQYHGGHVLHNRF